MCCKRELPEGVFGACLQCFPNKGAEKSPFWCLSGRVPVEVINPAGMLIYFSIMCYHSQGLGQAPFIVIQSKQKNIPADF